MCTLTGAQGISTGKYHAAHLTNDGAYENLAQEAGKVSGDLTFPLVYTPELHFAEFTSAVADMKNSVMVITTYPIVLIDLNYLYFLFALRIEAMLSLHVLVFSSMPIWALTTLEFGFILTWLLQFIM